MAVPRTGPHVARGADGRQRVYLDGRLYDEFPAASDPAYVERVALDAYRAERGRRSPSTPPGLGPVLAKFDWWRGEARDLLRSKRTLEIQAGRRLNDLLDAIEYTELGRAALRCCDVARIKPCVCEIARTCAVHGDLHRGSHD